MPDNGTLPLSRHHSAAVAVFGKVQPFQPLWTRVHDPYSLHPSELPGSRPPKATHFQLNEGKMRSRLVHGGKIALPLPDGLFVMFQLYDTTLVTMEPGLAEKFPDIKTFHCKAVGGTTHAPLNGELSLSNSVGFHGQLFSPSDGHLYIDQFSRRRGDLVSVYSRRDNAPFIHKNFTFHGSPHDREGPVLQVCYYFMLRDVPTRFHFTVMLTPYFSTC